MFKLVFLRVIENVFTTFFNKVEKVKSKSRKNNSTSKTINTAELQKQKPLKFLVNESHHKNTSSGLSKLPSIAKESQR